MKWWKVFAVVAVLLGVVATASGDSNTYNYQTNGGVNFNVKSGQVVDASGNAKVVDADRDRDLAMGQFSIINTLLGSANRTDSLTYGADSSIAFPVGNARHITLWLDAKTTTAKDVRVAVQFRLHYSATMDSVNTATVMPTQMFGYGNGHNSPALADSIGDIAAAATGQARPSETLVVWRAAGGFGGSAAAEWSAPRGKILTFEVPAGVGAYFSVRVRNLSAGYAVTSTANATNSGPIRIAVHYKASAL